MGSNRTSVKKELAKENTSFKQTNDMFLHLQDPVVSVKTRLPLKMLLHLKNVKEHCTHASSKKIKLDISDEDELIDECYMFINSDIVLR